MVLCIAALILPCLVPLPCPRLAALPFRSALPPCRLPCLEAFNCCTRLLPFAFILLPCRTCWCVTWSIRFLVFPHHCFLATFLLCPVTQHHWSASLSCHRAALPCCSLLSCLDCQAWHMLLPFLRCRPASLPSRVLFLCCLVLPCVVVFCSPRSSCPACLSALPCCLALLPGIATLPGKLAVLPCLAALPCCRALLPCLAACLADCRPADRRPAMPPCFAAVL